MVFPAELAFSSPFQPTPVLIYIHWCVYGNVYRRFIDRLVFQRLSPVPTSLPILLTNTPRSCLPSWVSFSITQTLIFEYDVMEGDLTESLSLSDRHALVFGFNATLGSSGYERKLRSVVAQASTNPTVAVQRVREKHNWLKTDR